MSGITAAFVCPYFIEHVEIDGRIATSILTKALNAPPWAGSGIDFDLIPPGITPVELDAAMNEVGGRTPRYGVCLVQVKGTAAQINDIAAIPDVWRLRGDLTEAQRNGIEARLRERGLETELGQTSDVAEMAGRVAAVLVPGWSGFSATWTPTA